jgi:hypothetical protein
MVVVVSATLAAARPDPGRPSAGLPPYVYFFGCLGTYLQLETTTHEVRARGTIWDAPSAAVIRPDAVTTADGCLLNQVEYDRHTGVLYVVLSQELRLDPEGRRQYRIAVLQLPHFTLMTKRDINVALEEPPRIALSPDGSTLLVNFTLQEDSPQGETERDVLFRYRGPALQQDIPPQEVRRLSAQQAITHGLYLSKRAYWSRQGHIVDENLLLDEHGNVLRRVDGYALLTDTIKGTFRSLERLEGPQKQALDISFADSAAGRILFVLGWDMTPNRQTGGSGLLVYDTATDQTLPPILLPYRAAPALPSRMGTPTAHLTPTGEFAVVENYVWRQAAQETPGTPAFERFKTGEMAIYNVQTGTRVQTIHLTPAPGWYAHVIGFSPDGQLMYYFSPEHLYAVYPLTGQVVTKSKAFSPIVIVFSEQ